MAEPDFYEHVGTKQPTERASRPVSVAGCAPEPQPRETLSREAMAGLKRWAASHDMFWGATQTHDELPAGLYRAAHDINKGVVLVRQRVETDSLIEFPDDASASIISEFQDFWNLGDEFRKRGFLHKRGFLLWGPPGSGKTSTVHVLVKRLISDLSGVVLFVDEPGLAAGALQMLRTIEPKRPLIAIIEDLDALTVRYGEHEFLALLDGEAQVDNVVFVASTNYPERLDPRFVDRPSRFDTVRYIGMPSAAARKAYLKAKEPSLTDGEMERWVTATEGFSVAHLKELIIAVRCLGQEFKDAIARLEKMHERRPTSDDTPDKSQVGFMSRAGVRAA